MTKRKDPAKPPLPAPAPTAHLPRFAPVPVKPRVDGWTPERQRAFIGALADSGCVRRAAAQVHMTPESAYWLRRRPGAEGFRKAWDAALTAEAAPLREAAMTRAIEGELVPVFQRGKLLGYRRVHNDRLLMQILRLAAEDAEGRPRVEVQFIRRTTRRGGGT